MRKVTAGLFVSLDGVVESPESWQLPYFNDEMGKAVGVAMAATDAMLLGRVTTRSLRRTGRGFLPRNSRLRIT
jgi:hypothetical protein